MRLVHPQRLSSSSASAISTGAAIFFCGVLLLSVLNGATCAAFVVTPTTRGDVVPIKGSCCWPLLVERQTQRQLLLLQRHFLSPTTMTTTPLRRPPSPTALDMSILTTEDQDGDEDDTAVPVSRSKQPKQEPPVEELLEDASKESSIDWDAEWKKVKSGVGQPLERPGRDFYKSEAEIAAIRAANKAAQEAQKQYSKVRIPSFQSLQGDWKFWIGVLLAVSFGAALLSAVSSSSLVDPPASISSQESYFI